MKKILLVHPPHYNVEESNIKTVSSSLPLGLAYIAAVLHKAGYGVEVLDIHALELDRDEVMDRLKDYDCDVVGINAFSTQWNYVKWLILYIKEDIGARVVVGGPLATNSPHMTILKTAVDVCVIGEGEDTMLDLLANWDNMGRVDGVVYRDNGNVVQTRPRKQIENIESIPYPMYDLFPMDIYLNRTHLYNDFSEPTINYIGSRGCPYRCTFCSRTFKSIRLKSIDYIIDELKFIRSKFGVRRIRFHDELFVVNKTRTMELVRKMESLNIIWNCQGRINTVDYELLKEMKKSGCISIGFGIESGSAKILKAMKKGITVEQIEKSMKDAIRAGLQIKVQLMFGYPGDDEDTLRETINLFARIGNAGREMRIVTPLPGTELYDWAIKNCLIKDEEKYLENLTLGYKRGSPVLIKLTKFEPEELLKMVKDTQEQMIKNYRKFLLKHPMFLSRRMIEKIKYKMKTMIGRISMEDDE